MGRICITRATGRVREWSRTGELSLYDAATCDILDSDQPPPVDTYWDGAAWVPVPALTNVEKDANLQAFLDSTAGIVVKSIVTALIKKGVVTLAEIRTEYRALTN